MSEGQARTDDAEPRRGPDARELRSAAAEKASPSRGLPLHRFSLNAMATTFEAVIACEDGDYARQAAETAFEEVERLERELSRFVPSSDIYRVNSLAAREPVRIGADTRDCLELARSAHSETFGAFDPTVGALLETFARARGEGRERPSPQELEAAMTLTGMRLVRFDEETMSVTLAAEGVRLDLGGIGKGYALDRMAELLADWGLAGSFLLHAGQSSVLARGESSPGSGGWRVSLRDPTTQPGPSGPTATGAGLQLDSRGSVLLRDCALSGSGIALHGLHIVDPRTGRPASGRLGAWAIAPSAGLSDALSTAFMVMSEDEVRTCCDRNPGVGGMILIGSTGGPAERRFGSWG